MKPRISIITLAVSDLHRAHRFYHEGLGLPFEGRVEEGSDHIAYFLDNGLSLVLFLQSEMNKITGAQTAAPHGHMLSYAAENKEDVDVLMQRGVTFGATQPGVVQDAAWGYFGCFKDPDGHAWEIIFNPEF